MEKYAVSTFFMQPTTLVVSAEFTYMRANTLYSSITAITTHARTCVHRYVAYCSTTPMTAAMMKHTKKPVLS